MTRRPPSTATPRTVGRRGQTRRMSSRQRPASPVGYPVSQPDGSHPQRAARPGRSRTSSPPSTSRATGTSISAPTAGTVVSPWQTCASGPAPPVGRITCDTLGNYIDNTRLDFVVTDVTTHVTQTVSTHPINTRNGFGGGFFGDYTDLRPGRTGRSTPSGPTRTTCRRSRGSTAPSSCRRRSTRRTSSRGPGTSKGPRCSGRPFQADRPGPWGCTRPAGSGRRRCGCRSCRGRRPGSRRRCVLARAPVITGNITDPEAVDQSGLQQRPAQAEAADRAQEPRAVLLHRPHRLDRVPRDQAWSWPTSAAPQARWRTRPWTA